MILPGLRLCQRCSERATRVAQLRHDMMCPRCLHREGGSLTSWQARDLWPRLYGRLWAYVGFEGLASRYLAKAANGEEPYLRIALEAFRRRHKRRRLA